MWIFLQTADVPQSLQLVTVIQLYVGHFTIVFQNPLIGLFLYAIYNREAASKLQMRLTYMTMSYIYIYTVIYQCHVHVYTYTCIYTHIHTYIYMYVCVCVCRLCACVCVCACVSQHT